MRSWTERTLFLSRPAGCPDGRCLNPPPGPPLRRRTSRVPCHLASGTAGPRSPSDHRQPYQLCGRADNTPAMRVVCTWEYHRDSPQQRRGVVVEAVVDYYSGRTGPVSPNWPLSPIGCGVYLIRKATSSWVLLLPVQL